MTYPSANPGGEHNWLVRTAVRDWIDAQSIPGLSRIFRTLSAARDWDEADVDDLGCMALASIHIPRDSESRAALTGPNDPGGKDITYDVELHVVHLSPNDGNSGEEDAQRSYSRLLDRLKDAMRGAGRDLGRPEVILQAGDWPRDGGLQCRHNEPEHDEESGYTYRSGMLTFVVSQYLPTFIP